MSKYSGLLKGVKDLLQKPYNYDNKVELKQRASNGVTFTSDATIPAEGPAVANINVTGKHGNFSVDKLTVGTEKKLIGEFTFAEAAPKTDVNFKFTDGTHASGVKSSATVGAVFPCPITGATWTVDAETLEGPNVDFTFLGKYKSFLYGGSLRVNSSFLPPLAADGGKGESKKDDKVPALVSLGPWGEVIGYQADDYTLFAQTKFNKLSCQTVDFGLTVKATPELTSGFLVSTSCKDAKANTSVLFGGSYAVDAATTVYSTVDDSAKVSFAYKQKLNTLATVTVSSQVDALNLASDNHKFGLTLNIAN
jgi:voltage-dependent anion channel protein 2